MKILITGAAGFIASHITDAYLKAGHEVVIIDNLSTGKRENVPSNARLYELSITDKKIIQVFKEEKPDIVNHHAAQIDIRKSVENPQTDAEINIVGSLNILEASRLTGVKKIIFASSGGSVYGNALSFPTTETHPTNPTSPYGIAKLSVEKYLQYYHWSHQLPFVALRYANVYGPRQNPFGEAGVIAIFIHKLLKGQTPTIYGDGKQTRDYVFIDDVVSSNLKALTTDVTGIFNIGTGIETSLNTLTGQMIESLHASILPKHAAPKKGEQIRCCLNPGLIQSSLPINLKQGLKQTIAWFKNITH